MGSADPLEVWAVATFDVVTFGVVGLLAGHLGGVLAAVLPGVGTLWGALVFGYLWALAVVATRWALADGGLDRIDDGETSSLLLRGTVAGAFVGAGFLLGVVLVGGLVSLLTNGFELLSLGLLALLGGAISAVVGAVVGAAFVVVDAALYRAVAVLVPGPADGR